MMDIVSATPERGLRSDGLGSAPHTTAALGTKSAMADPSPLIILNRLFARSAASISASGAI